jgi:DNA-directed RNA polymerase subunit RPC12/RpoP
MAETYTQTIEGKPFKCPQCGAAKWLYKDDHDNGDWVEAIYVCGNCGHYEYVELPD